MYEAFVYCWKDNLNNKIYIGSHKGTLDDGYICSSKIMLKEYKERPNDFERHIVAQGDAKGIRKLESKILQAANAATQDYFYNQSNQDGKFVCFGHSEETKQKMSISHTGKKRSPEAVEKTRQAHLGRKRSEETKQKMRDNHTHSLIGRKHSEETLAKMSKPHKKRINLNGS